MANRLAILAEQISNAIQSVNKYLEENNLPQPTFEPDGPMDLKLNAEVQGAAFKAMDAAQELYDLLKGPHELTVEHLHPPVAIYDIIRKFDIVNKVPLNGDISYPDLASATGIEQSVLARIIRLATLSHVFAEKRAGYVSHTLSTKMLAMDDLHNSLVGMIQEDIVPGWMRLADALKKWPGADEPSQTAFMLAEDGNQETFFQQLGLNPERAARFARSMSAFSLYENIGKDYDWTRIAGGKGTLVELGGSTGDVAFKISEEYPSLNIVVQDMKEVIARAKQRDGCNVSFQAHNFFDEEPIKGADAYMIRWCLHDWSDHYCTRILRALIPALGAGTKVLIVDAVVPAFGALPVTAERRLRTLDVVMLTIANAKERTLDDWQNLFASTDARLKFQRVVPLTNSRLSVIEVEWQP